MQDVVSYKARETVVFMYRYRFFFLSVTFSVNVNFFFQSNAIREREREENGCFVELKKKVDEEHVSVFFSINKTVTENLK